jgi:hypothetical protein
MKKRRRFSAFQKCSKTRPWPSVKRYTPGLIFSVTTYGPVHLASSMPVLSVWGLLKCTKFPISNSHNLTFGSLQALVSSWYFCKFATALSLSDSSRYLFLASLGHTGASVVVHKLWCFTSSGNTTSVPYISRNGVNFFALHTVVLWLHYTFGMTSAHLPFFSPLSIFLIVSNMCWPYPLHHWIEGDTPTWMRPSFQPTGRNPWTLHCQNTLRCRLWCVRACHSGRWCFARRIFWLLRSLH